jgi:exodeoxyribonuclease-3
MANGTGMRPRLTKFDYKLAWLKHLTAHAADLYASGGPVMLAGDYYVVPTDLDLYPTKSGCGC